MERNPKYSSEFKTFLSLARFPMILRFQKVFLVAGYLKYLHRECPCQKHPCTCTTVFHFGRTMSGRPGRPLPCTLNRKPCRHRALRTAFSGLVFLPRMPDIIRDLVARSTTSVILVSLPEPGYRRDMPSTVTVIDLFAGPGGLAEGFAGFALANGHQPFRIGVSAEMEPSAHATLSLRALYRRCMSSDRRKSKAYWDLFQILAENPVARPAAVASTVGLTSFWHEVERESLQLTLGTGSGNEAIRRRLRQVMKSRRNPVVLIGGPPCQAYSLIGRARNRGIRGYRPEDDKRHFLYQEYLSILQEFEPDLFVMENVKGILSSTVQGTRVFERILEDLQQPSGKGGAVYDIVPLAVRRDTRDSGRLWPEASDFVIRSEDFGIPQSRHRVIVFGIRRRSGALQAIGPMRLDPSPGTVTLGDVLCDLPRLRSGLNDSFDTGSSWQRTMREQQRLLHRMLRKSDPELADHVARRRFGSQLSRCSTRYASPGRHALVHRQHYRNPDLKLLVGHETRTHMASDLCRYLFCASYAAVYGCSPTSSVFPKQLQPAHRSWRAGHFADRFRVQLRDQPASTVTSHLAKDGHHFIHWDPQQCRSLTVREAARAQTFPDDYLFLGNRTQQYTQIGNAVPPLLAAQIAAVAAGLLL